MYYGSYKPPSDIMEHLDELKWYGNTELAKFRLSLIAKHIDDPMKIRVLEDQWVFSNARHY